MHLIFLADAMAVAGGVFGNVTRRPEARGEIAALNLEVVVMVLAPGQIRLIALDRRPNN
jgi:hypothetical protein